MLYDTKTTAEDVAAITDQLAEIVTNSGLSANVLYVMFQFYATQLMGDIVNAAKAERISEEK